MPNKNEISDTLTALLRLRGETRERDYPGMTDAAILARIGRKIRRHSPVGSVVCETAALALRRAQPGRGN